MLNERRRKILSALVRHYIRSAQPVSSKVLVDRYRLDCSPATVRHDLSALEDSGHVRQPHVSAGRIPTDAGYRAFVDDMVERHALRGLSAAETDAVRERLGALRREIHDKLRETASILSHLTNQVAVVVAPPPEGARIRRIDVVPMSPRHVLLVVITDSGDVAKAHLDLPEEASPEELRALEDVLSRALHDLSAEEVLALPDAALEVTGAHRRVARVLANGAGACLASADDERLFHGGAPNLLAQPEFADSAQVRPLLQLLEDGIAMLEVLGDAAVSQDVVVRIGAENTRAEMARVSIVAAPYAAGEGRGVVALLGPTRMDYGRSMTAVRIVADTLSDTGEGDPTN